MGCAGRDDPSELTELLKDISLVQILRLTDGPIAMVSCASLNYYHKCDECADEQNCGIRKTFILICDANLEILSRTSIADLVTKERRVAENNSEAEQVETPN